MQKKSTNSVIGRLEKIDLPELALSDLDAKIDTGAYTSSLHCHDLKLVFKDGEQWVQFYVLDPQHPEYENRIFECPVHKIKSVKSSNGLTEERVIIKQNAIFNGKKYKIQLSLANRSKMKFPVLIGRRFLNKKFIVDVSKRYLTLRK